MSKRSRKGRSRSLTGRGSFSRPLSLVRPAAAGAAGALLINGIVNHAPLPDTLKAGNMIFVTRAALAIALGLFGPRLPIIGAYAREGAIGALIVTATDFGKLMALQQGINLSGMGYIGPARVVPMGQLLARPGVNRGNPVMRPNLAQFIRTR